MTMRNKMMMMTMEEMMMMIMCLLSIIYMTLVRWGRGGGEREKTFHLLTEILVRVLHIPIHESELEPHKEIRNMYACGKS